LVLSVYMTEGSLEEHENAKKEPTVRKADIATKIFELARVKNNIDPQKNLYYPNYGYLADQMTLVARELASKLPQVYGNLSKKLEHNQAEVAAILDQLLESTEKNDRRGKNLRKNYINKDLLQEVFTNLFPPPPEE